MFNTRTPGGRLRTSIGTRPAHAGPRRTESLLGVPMGSLEFDQQVPQPTALGRRWGIDRGFRGDYSLAVSSEIQPLAIDELGRASAWVRVYRADRPWAGFVQLWGLGASADRLALVRAVAEYGLTRAALDRR